MDPLSIAASVGALTATCLSTCKKLSDLAGSYQDVPVVIAMVCSEATVVSIALSELQKSILQRPDLAQAWASRTDVLVAFETVLTGCMIVFSCLEAETRQLQSQIPNSSGMRVWAKLRFLWNQDRLKELLSALRGQHSSINFLIQVLEIPISNTLSDIERNIRDNKSIIQKPASEAQSFRPLCCGPYLGHRSFGTRIDFDDAVLNSQAYRRVYARAQLNADDIGLYLSDGTTIRRVNRDLVDLNLATTAEPPSPTKTGDFSPQQEAESTAVRDESDPGTQEPLNLSQLTTCPELTCGKCSRAIIGQFVREQGGTFHPDCFTCSDCSEPIRTKFFPLKHGPGTRICEKDYFRRLSLCHTCGQGLKDTHIMPRDKKYHSMGELPPTSLGADDGSNESGFLEENDIQVYDMPKRRDSVGSVIKAPQAAHLDMLPGLAGERNSHPDYCQIYAERCASCQLPILEQSMATRKQGTRYRWHPVCYEVRVSWGVSFPPSRKVQQYLEALHGDKEVETLTQNVQDGHEALVRRTRDIMARFHKAFEEEASGALYTSKGDNTKSFQHFQVLIGLASHLFQNVAIATNRC
ncbi:hypothetical protein LCI18_002080 [Fusarium solani-melongenae]|uniref:Uncharacterized protein n=1 Tax=Fusarium solani subsp. cucurbitae TaxID=2747967 RepID=A0ACD3YQD6_FUSSC|nr:hypothetical protein LCI18_002080 [Fusarium solani-melongenae]